MLVAYWPIGLRDVKRTDGLTRGAASPRVAALAGRFAARRVTGGTALRSIGVLLLVVVALGGCAWRSRDAEHYVGPVLFRYSGPSENSAHVSQVVGLGFLGEGGAQWGLSVGASERIAVAPRYVEEVSESPPPAGPRWRMPLSLLGSPRPDRWTLSLLYVRLEEAPPARFVIRRVWGAQVLIGGEANSASLGVVARTRVEPAGDAFSLLEFDGRRPLATRFLVWREGADAASPRSGILKEVEP